MTLTDVYRNHYHSAEYHSGNLYIIRRINYEGYPDEEWSDELWKYSKEKKGIRLFSSKGIDFRVSWDGNFAAVENDKKLIFLRTSNGEIAKEFGLADLNIYKETPVIGLIKWSDNSQFFWGDLSFTVYPQAFFRINIINWTVDKFDVVDLPLQISELDLNPNTRRIVFSDFPAMFDVEPVREFEASKSKVTLFVYDLITQSKRIIATSTAKTFKPE